MATLLVAPPGWIDPHNWTGPSTFFPGTIQPTNDSSGAEDTAIVQQFLNNNGFAVLQPGATFYQNATWEIPNGGGGLIGGGGQDLIGDLGATTLIMAAGANLNAQVASGGWLESTNTSAAAPSLVRDIFFNGNQANQTAGLGHALVLQCTRGAVENCTFNGVRGDGIFYTHLGFNGTTAIGNQAAENKIDRCRFRNITGNSITSDDNNVSAVFTDGFISDCVFGSTQGVDPVSIGQGGGWIVQGSHFYGLTQNGIVLNKPVAARVLGNYLETWGQSATPGTYAAIKLTNVSATAKGNIITANEMNLGTAPNAGSTTYGIQLNTANGSNGLYVVTGNSIFASVTPATAGIIFNNGNASSSTTATSTGNLISGFTTAVLQVAAGGTMTVSAGV